MDRKNTKDLETILGSTHVSQIDDFLKEHQDSMLAEDRPFSQYMRELFRKKGLKQQDIFLGADIPERYGYKLISEEKRTRQRDTILRICYAAHFTLEETQRALRIYAMPELYSKVPRDAFLMIIFNERPGSILDVNSLLLEHKIEPLKASGELE